MTFEDDFPSLKGKLMGFDEDGGEHPMVYCDDVQEHCLDKAKARAAIDNCEDDVRLALIDGSGKDRWHLIRDILKEELGI